MEITRAHACFVEVFGEIFGHAFGERGDEDARAGVDDGLDFADGVIDLSERGPDVEDGVEQACRADELLDDFALGLFDLAVARGRGDIDDLVDEGFEFLEIERAVVECGRQPEAVIDEDLLARPVAPVHAADLRDADMAFVNDEQEVVGKIIDEARRCFAGFASGQMA